MSEARVGIVLPTYNRAHLLPMAIESVLAQLYDRWELIVVDDNSTDDTPRLLEDYHRRDARIRYVRNDRYGHCCSGARKRGLDELTHEFVAFLDSDDRWPANHLSAFASILDQNPDIDWVFGDVRRVEPSGRTVVESKFRKEWPGLKALVEEERDGLYILRRDDLVESALEHGFFVSLQPSLIRHEVFDAVEYHEVPTVCDDRLFGLQAAAQGVRFAYVLSHHLDFLIHDDNMSGARSAASFHHRLQLNKGVERYWRELVPRFVPMNRRSRVLLRKRLAEHYVWMLGNNVYRAAGRRWRAVSCISRGIVLDPLEWKYWKTLAGTLLGR